MTYDLLLSKSDNSIKFLTGIISESKVLTGRFNQYINIVTALNKAVKQRNVAFPIIGHDETECAYALKELDELVTIFESISKIFLGLNDVQKETITNKLLYILQGPTFEQRETNSNNRARNYQSELLLATRFIQANVDNLSFLENPDLQPTINKHLYAFECKRMTSHSTEKMVKRVKEGIDQLDKLSGSYIGKFVYIDLSPKFNRIYVQLKTKTDKIAEDFAQKFIEDELKYLDSKPDIIIRAQQQKISGLLGSLSFVVIINNAYLKWCNEIAILPFDKELFSIRNDLIRKDLSVLEKKRGVIMLPEEIKI